MSFRVVKNLCPSFIYLFIYFSLFKVGLHLNYEKPINVNSNAAYISVNKLPNNNGNNKTKYLIFRRNQQVANRLYITYMGNEAFFFLFCVWKILVFRNFLLFREQATIFLELCKVLVPYLTELGFLLWRTFRVWNETSEQCHLILHIRIRLAIKFQLKLTILIFWTKFAQKGCFPSKTEKVNCTTEFSMFDLVSEPNFRLNWQPWFFGPNFFKRCFWSKTDHLFWNRSLVLKQFTCSVLDSKHPFWANLV